MVAPGSAPEEADPPNSARPLGPGERHARLGLIRRAQGTEFQWFERHWFAIMLPTTLGLAAFFIYFALRNGFDWGTVFFGVVAALGLLAVVVRFVFGDRWWVR